MLSNDSHPFPLFKRYTSDKVTTSSSPPPASPPSAPAQTPAFATLHSSLLTPHFHASSRLPLRSVVHPMRLHGVTDTGQDEAMQNKAICLCEFLPNQCTEGPLITASILFQVL
ncbi:hypothetical protein TcWFU_002156 [Taenia crassiceps]|uniref:Uncharacterized protein n=1 Tax=Taenia crassiceps TaxID=6207 RepID=A0ABR4Q2B5_9CEST